MNCAFIGDGVWKNENHTMILYLPSSKLCYMLSVLANTVFPLNVTCFLTYPPPSSSSQVVVKLFTNVVVTTMSVMQCLMKFTIVSSH